MSPEDVNVLASSVQLAHYIGWKIMFIVLIRQWFPADQYQSITKPLNGHGWSVKENFDECEPWKECFILKHAKEIDYFQRGKSKIKLHLHKPVSGMTAWH